jgi:hypothetical protein
VTSRAALVTVVACLALAVPVASAAGGVPLLGSSIFYSPHSKGFGTPHPRAISNGGDPSGIVSSITWKSWGGALAIGDGMSSIFRPNGGFYPRLVRIELRAQHPGRCHPGGAVVYRQLVIREPKKPGGPLGSWFLWSGARSLCSQLPA